MLMAKKSFNIKLNAPLLMLIVVAVIVAGYFGYKVVENMTQAQSDRNWEIIIEADKKSDKSICDNIKGVTFELIGEPSVRTVPGLMSENETRKLCALRVHQD